METPITPPPVAPTPAPMTAPPMTPATPASSKRWLWISLIAVVVLAGAAYGWMKLYPKTPMAEVTPTPSASVVATATTNPTAGWKTYTDTAAGYQFKYPSDKEVLADGGTVYVDTPAMIAELRRVSGSGAAEAPQMWFTILATRPTRALEPQCKSAGLFPSAAITLSIGGNAVPGCVSLSDEGIYPAYNFWASFNQDGTHYFINGKGPYRDADRAVWDQILSTFKFTRTP